MFKQLVQWRSQPKILGGQKIWGRAKLFDFRRITLLSLGYRLSKHKMTTYAKIWGAWPSGYAYELV